jgi:hypothetical protein
VISPWILYIDDNNTANPNIDQHMVDARARLAALQQRLSNTSISILGGEEGATILIDKEDWGRTPRHDPILIRTDLSGATSGLT